MVVTLLSTKRYRHHLHPPDLRRAPFRNYMVTHAPQRERACVLDPKILSCVWQGHKIKVWRKPVDVYCMYTQYSIHIVIVGRSLVSLSTLRYMRSAFSPGGAFFAYLSPAAADRPAVWGSPDHSCPTCPVRPHGGPSRPPGWSTTAAKQRGRWAYTVVSGELSYPDANEWDNELASAKNRWKLK